MYIKYQSIYSDIFSIWKIDTDIATGQYLHNKVYPKKEYAWYNITYFQMHWGTHTMDILTEDDYFVEML